MRDVYVVATGCTTFGNHVGTTSTALAADALRLVMDDLSVHHLHDVGSAWFGSCFLDAWGQPNIRGQAVLAPLAESGVLPPRLGVTNVEAACATGSVALLGAVNEVRAGVVDAAVAVGVEKMRFDATVADDRSIFDSLAGCAESLDEGRLEAAYRAATVGTSHPFAPVAGISMFMETYAVQARLHMERWGVSERQIAVASSTTHLWASLNPLAQYQFEVSVDDVLADRPVTYPFTRSMCAPITDGAAAAVVASQEWLDRQPVHVQKRAVRVAGIGMTSGRYDREPDEPTLSHYAAAKAYSQAGISPADIDLVEVHDATSYGQILQLEMLGLCAPGEAGKFIESGATGPGGELPVNTSGGLVGKGHPVAATGLSMVHELTSQLRHEAGPRQVPGARTGVAENGGGVLGLEEATCVVTILERAS